MKSLVLVAFVAFFAGLTHAEVSLARVFQDNMVLQADKNVAVWGKADPDMEIVVEFGGQVARTKAKLDGWWKTTFSQPFSASKTGRELVVKGTKNGKSESVRVGNVLVGEVWILSGQSNMEWNVGETDEYRDALLRADDDAHKFLRYQFIGREGLHDEPQRDLPTNACWKVCSSKVVAGMSATGYYFGEKLLADRDVPVGLIMTACGATQVQNWTPRDCLEGDAFLSNVIMPAYEKERSRADAEGRELKHNQWPSRHFNTKVAPLSGLACRGVLWYQGETGGWAFNDNPSHPAAHFSGLLQNMVKGWRAHWSDDDLWFVIYELPSLSEKHGAAGWPLMRQQLREASENLKNAVAVNIVDTGCETNVHPRAKKLVGFRGALQAERAVYGDMTVLPPPRFVGAEFLAGQVLVRFDKKVPLKTTNGELASECAFEVLLSAGWTNAVATLGKENCVRLMCPGGVKERPKGIRHLYRSWAKPHVWLCNEQGYPAETFKYMAEDVFRPAENVRCEYSDRVAKRGVRRGVMSPARPMSTDDFETLQRWGATLVRYQISGGQPDLANLKEYDAWLSGKLDHFEEFVLPEARKRGMMVVLDMHETPGGRIRKMDSFLEHAIFWDDQYLRHFVKCWRQIAQRFKGNEDVIFGYDLVNEPFQRQGVPFDYREVQVRAARAIREVDFETPVIFESNGNCAAGRYWHLEPLPFRNVIYQVHMYDPFEMTHQQISDVNQVHSVWPDVKKGWNREWLEKRFAQVDEFSRRFGAKVYVGEFSCIGWSDGAEKWLADCLSVMNARGFDWTYHAFREWPPWSVEHETKVGDPRGVAVADTLRKQVLIEGLKAEAHRESR